MTAVTGSSNKVGDKKTQIVGLCSRRYSSPRSSAQQLPKTYAVALAATILQLPPHTQSTTVHTVCTAHTAGCGDGNE